MRTKKLTIRLTEQEKSRLEWKAKQTGMSISALMRSTALDVDISEDARLSVLKDILGSFNKTGNLLDQLAKAVNGEKHVDLAVTSQIFKHVVESYSKLRDDVERLNDR